MCTKFVSKMLSVTIRKSKLGLPVLGTAGLGGFALISVLGMWYVEAQQLCGTETTAIDPMLAPLQRHTRDNSKDAYKDAFYGIQIKWKLVFPVKSFTGLKSKFQWALPIKIPFSVFSSEKESQTRVDDEDFYDTQYPDEGELERLNRRFRREARQERRHIYHILETFFEGMGLPPKHCLLRTICEVAEIPFEESLFGDTLNIILQASTAGRPDSPEEEDYNSYIDAEFQGRNLGQCHQVYSNCSQSIFDSLPWLYHELVNEK